MELVSALQAVQTGAAVLQQIQHLNETGQAGDAAQEQDETVDPGQDPTLVREDKDLAKTPGMSLTGHLRIQTGTIDIGFTLSFTKEKGKEEAPEIGLEAEGEDGQMMEGSLGETSEKDFQGNFTSEKWGKIQENRAICIRQANQGLARATQLENNLDRA